MTTPASQELGRAAVSLRPYDPDDADAVVQLWNACDVLGSDFPMDARLWRQNVDACPATAWPASFVASDPQRSDHVVGVIIVKHLRHISAIAVHPDWQRRGVGRTLVEAAMAATRRDAAVTTAGTWTAGADLCHFFPGVPVQAEAALGFFRALGFTVGEESSASYDLMRDLRGFVMPAAIAESIDRLSGQGIVIAPCREEDVPALRACLAETFPGRWLDDTMRRIEMEPDPSEIIIAREASGAVLGFAHTFSNRSRWIGPPVYWRPLLGERYGGLGPIGLAVRARKLGLGLALLAVGVQAVADTGAEKMAIDWTNLLDFYAKVGFAPWKTYLSAWRKPIP